MDEQCLTEEDDKKKTQEPRLVIETEMDLLHKSDNEMDQGMQ